MMVLLGFEGISKAHIKLQIITSSKIWVTTTYIIVDRYLIYIFVKLSFSRIDSYKIPMGYDYKLIFGNQKVLC